MLHTDKAVVRIVPADKIHKQKIASKRNQPPEPSLAPGLMFISHLEVKKGQIPEERWPLKNHLFFRT